MSSPTPLLVIKMHGLADICTGISCESLIVAAQRLEEAIAMFVAAPGDSTMRMLNSEWAHARRTYDLISGHKG